ncbi:MAG: FtsQ-type POTRA domain-containing protein [Clostridia bacterium]|nr:FtsQ-type POTRA domain-containing protein [Clostridia bacterium]
MDNENKNIFENRPFSTFDWSDSIKENVSKPKDITSDMWTPISAGAERREKPSSSLSDRQKPVRNTSGAQNKKKPPQKKRPPQNGKPASKKRPSQPSGKSNPERSGQKKQSQKNQDEKRRPQERPSQKSNPSRSKSANQPQNRRPAQSEEAKRAAEEKRRKLERERERRQYEAERRRYEKASESYNRQRIQGSSREEISKKRAKKKRRSKRFYAVTITAATLVVAVIATLVFCFAVGSPVKTITASGKSVYSSDEIVSACGIVPGENIFTVSEKKVNAVLTSSLPYIGSVKVKRDFPDKLSLTVTATSEKYLIPNTNGYICLDKNEKVLSTKKQKLKTGCFRLDGFKGQSVKAGTAYEPCKEDESRFETAKTIIALLEENGLKKANVLKLSSLTEIVVVYDRRFNIYIGSADNIEKKIELAARVIKESVGKSNTGYIDVRYDSRAYFSEGNMNQQ